MTNQLPAEPSDEMVRVEQRSPKSYKLALTLGCFTGFLGLHRFYTGRPWTGLLMALTGGGFLAWWVIDFFVLLTGRFKDSEGRVLGRPLAVRPEEVENLPDEVRRKIPEQELESASDEELLEDPLEDPLAEEFDALEEELEPDRATDGRP